MNSKPWGRILAGQEQAVRKSYQKWNAQPVDREMGAGDEAEPGNETSIASEAGIAGPGTFLGKARRTLTFTPGTKRGWYFDRSDLPESMPIPVSINNVWTTARNIVLSSGSPHNYMRMVEHMVALKVGLRLDNVVIRMDSGDPPLFDRSSLDLVETVETAGIEETGNAARYVTVREPVSVAGPKGSFLTFLPAENGSRRLDVDCAIDFRSAIGKQRIKFTVCPRNFRHGSFARTNAPLMTMIYCKTIGKIFADIRNLGYTTKNILIAGPSRYINEPRLLEGGKSLEAVWHRATLDLLAAVALIDKGRLAGRVISYKAGHSLDVQMIKKLYRHDLLTDV
jgi:UDP-3-O-acyl-N-acetylglucosamine deacetylase